MTLVRCLTVCILTLSALSVTSCDNDGGSATDPVAGTSGATAGAGIGGEMTGGGGTAAIGGQGEVGGDGGALGGNDCANLVEAACEAAEGCVARYGAPSPDPLEDGTIYAGCATSCTNDDCPAPPDASACAKDETGACWTLSSPPVPDGWTLLGIDEDCSTLSDCSD